MTHFVEKLLYIGGFINQILSPSNTRTVHFDSIFSRVYLKNITGANTLHSFLK
jgi:hypothetical protein